MTTLSNEISGKLSVTLGAISLGLVLFSIWGVNSFFPEVERLPNTLGSASIFLAFSGLILAAISYIKRENMRLVTTGVGFSLLTVAVNFFLIAICVLVVVFVVYYFFSGG